LKIILAVDAIFPPLTGIGRYAWELARQLEKNREIDDIRYFSMGRWVDDLQGLLCCPENSTPAGFSPFRLTRKLSVSLRKYASRQNWAIHAYSFLIPRWTSYRLKPYKSHLYHSPNYFVPPLTGQAVATFHDLSLYKYPETHSKAHRTLFDLEISRTLRHVSHLITDSETTRREVIDFFAWPEDRVTAVHLGVDPAFHRRTDEELRWVLARYGLASGKYGLCVSTLDPRKKINALLQAYAELPLPLRNAYPLVLAGSSGWLNESTLKQLEKGKKENWVRHLGFVPDTDLPHLYAGARAFFYPSIYEGFGLPVLEAMASGVPVLTSDRSSLPEVAAGAAYLVDPNDHEALKDGIAISLCDEVWRAQAISLGLKNSSNKTWEICANKTIAVYKSILSA